MNTFWLKVAGGVVAIVILIVVINAYFIKPAAKPQTGQKTVYDVWEKDDKRLRADAQFKEPPTSPNQPAGQQQVQQLPTVVEPPKPQFKELTEEEKIEAERLYEMALTERKMGRLPVMTYKRMVDYCREIIRKWPESEYAFKAKRLLADIPERYHQMYNITKEEIDLGNLK
jgi:type IV secretory pathway VirB10-like protein